MASALNYITVRGYYVGPDFVCTMKGGGAARLKGAANLVGTQGSPESTQAYIEPCAALTSHSTANSRGVHTRQQGWQSYSSSLGN